MHRVGIIPFKVKDDAVALLFVTSQTRGRWVLPKGKQKRGETHAETCHREGFEEAGVRGIVLEDFPFTVKIGSRAADGFRELPVTFYPYLVLSQEKDWPERATRERHWALIEDCNKIAYPEDYMVLIEQFETLRPWIIESAKSYKEAPPATRSRAR